MKHTQNNQKNIIKYLTILIIIFTAMAGLFLGTAQSHWAKPDIQELEEAEVYIEWNSTDNDYGIQFFWDCEGFTTMAVINERGKAALLVRTSSNLRAQGLTEGFFESVEPTVEDLSMDEFLERFPEGTYRFLGWSTEGEWLVGETEFTHDLPYPPELNLEEFNLDDPTIMWTQPPGDAVVVEYEVVVELVVSEEGEDERVFVNTAVFPGNANEFTVSPEFIDLIEDSEDAGILKVEIIAREESGNKTITEEEVDLE